MDLSDRIDLRDHGVHGGPVVNPVKICFNVPMHSLPSDGSAPWRALAALAAVGALAIAAASTWYQRRLPEPSPPPEAPADTGATVEPADIPERHWVALRGGPGGAPVATGEAASGRFRLAGVFVALGGEADGSAPYRKAIIDDLQDGQQYLAGEDEPAGPARVLRVEADRVTLRIEGRTEELRLRYDHPMTAAGELALTGMEEGGEGEGTEPPLEVNAYGRRVQENRWVLSRDALTAYYREMLDYPERVALLYETFEPDRAPDGGIQGYRINVRGEEDFLHAVGLQANDVVREVNSLRMTSQTRAEFRCPRRAPWRGSVRRRPAGRPRSSCRRRHPALASRTAAARRRRRRCRQDAFLPRQPAGDFHRLGAVDLFHPVHQEVQRVGNEARRRCPGSCAGRA
jgi:type II secretory pathway component PulC